MHGFFFLDKLWKLDGTSLINQANLWQSKDEWNFQEEGDKIFLENVSERRDNSEKRILRVASDGKVVVETYDKEKASQAKQLWKKGEANSEGFFTLTNSDSKLLLTATSADNLEIKGMVSEI